jgi:hypothetical protein
MIKLCAVAAASLALGGLIGSLGFRNAANAAATDVCPRASQATVTRFFQQTVGKGKAAVVPAGCTNEVLTVLAIDLNATNQHWQALNASLASLQGKFSFFCRQTRQTSC